MNYYEQTAPIFINQLLTILRNDSQNNAEKTKAIWRLIQYLGEMVCKNDRHHYNNYATQFAYICHKYQLSPILNHLIYTLKRSKLEEADDDLFKKCLFVFTQLLEHVFECDLPQEIKNATPKIEDYTHLIDVLQYSQKSARVIVESIDNEEKVCVGILEGSIPTSVKFRYAVPHINGMFQRGIEKSFPYLTLPIIVQLIDIQHDESDIWVPKLIIIEPDYLMDVTAIAECYSDETPDPLQYLIRKLTPKANSNALLLGNIVNGFFDALVINPNYSFSALFLEVFKKNPLTMALLNDDQIKNLMMQCRVHYENLVNVINKDFKTEKIDLDFCYVEPSFYSPQYGLQGRLDLFFQKEASEVRPTIIELKSGKPEGDQAFHIRLNHFCQTMLYDLLIKSTFGENIFPANYILYSATEKNTLRFKATDPALQQHLLAARNQFLGVELSLSSIYPDKLDQPSSLDIFEKKNFVPKLLPFVKPDWAKLQAAFAQLSSLEKKYYKAYLGFIAREQQLSKIGIQGDNARNGVASLWINRLEDKIEQFDILLKLELIHFTQQEDAILLQFRRNDVMALANFRQGDIIIMYPYKEMEDGFYKIESQLFKSTIVKIETDEVIIRIKSIPNPMIFQEIKFWNIEHDTLDSSFNANYGNLFEFITASKYKRNLYLGLIPPVRIENESKILWDNHLTQNQKLLLDEILTADDYYLLWGPPGTGKTSTMIRYLVAHLLENTNEKILLLAYTNRAVDEICESIESIGNHIKSIYFRIGSRFSTSPDFLTQLLDQKIKEIKNRKQLLQLIDSHRIVVATLASFHSKKELLDLIKFDRVVIDEASQILDPQMIGLVAKFNKVLLIGDHKQLPAVVTQAKEYTKVTDEELNQIGINDLSSSLFERLYQNAVKNNWTWTYGQLNEQGRMHDDIMNFPNLNFYDGKLTSIVERQKLKWNASKHETEDDLYQKLYQNRVVFLPVTLSKDSVMAKVNEDEAIMIRNIIPLLFQMFEQRNEQLLPSDIGIITPFRAQIACIREHVAEKGIQIDTVERFQGGAKKVIIISLCISSQLQLSGMSSFTEDGIDRKLNVALTRAKEQLIILGNPEILSSHKFYQQFIQEYQL